MLKSYGALFQFPGAAAFSAAGFIARLPISQFGIATVLLVSAHSGSYTIAGRVAACATLAGAIVMPQVAKLVDRRGQAAVARPVIVIGTIAWLLLALAVTQEWPTWTWYVFAAIGGATGPSIGAMVRARWTYLLPDKALQQRAFSWESSIDEVVFVIGPPLATFLATAITPWAGVVTATVFLLVGGWIFTGLRDTEPPPSPAGSGISSLSLMSPALIAVCVVFVCGGTVFGAVDVIVVAFASEQGARGVAGVILAAYALGSLFAGLTFGVLKFRRSVGGQFVTAACLLAVLVPTLLLANNLWVLGILIFVAGSAIAPLLISATMLIERLVPQTALTEGLTWSITGLIAGVTIGSAGAGALVDEYGARLAFWLPAGAAVLAALIALATSPLLRHAAVQRTAARLQSARTDSVVPGAPVTEIDDPDVQ